MNNYGPTECTVVSTSGIIPATAGASHLPPIGAPIANTYLYLLNERLEPTELGSTGELFIDGVLNEFFDGTVSSLGGRRARALHCRLTEFH